MMNSERSMLVTGGSRGIGRAIAEMAASRGWAVTLTYRTEAEAAAGVVSALRAQGARAEAVQADVCEEDAVIAAFDAALSAHGRLDAVVVNAGIAAPLSPLAQMEAARLRRMVEVNLYGALLVAREAARRLPRDRNAASASLVFLSSGASRLGSPFEFVDYAATKGALDTLTLGLSKELAAANIRVNAVRAGAVATGLQADAGEPDRAARIGAGAPMGRAGTAGEIAEAALWLCGDAASYVTGALLDVTGGR